MNKEEIESLFKKYKVRIPKEKQGQSECYECKRYHKYSLTWTSFLYEYKENYYCFEHIVNILLQQENQELKEKIKTYEDPEDLTLMFMYCDEKAKDKIRELKKQLEDKEERLERLRISAIGHAKRELDLEKQQKEFIKWLEDYLNLFDYRNIEEQASYDMLEEILQKYKEIIGSDINVGSIGGKDER